MSVANQGPPSPSAVSTFISQSGAKSASEALALEIMHNLQHQHNWTELKRHHMYLNTMSSPPGLVDLDRPLRTQSFSSSGSGSGITSSSPSPSSSGTSTPSLPGGTVTIISGLPPQHSYIHPDLQAQLLKHGVLESALLVQREFVLPLSLGEKWSLARFCAVFDQLPERDTITVHAAASTSGAAGDTARRRGNGSSSNGGPRKAGVYEHRDQKRVLLGMKAREGVGGDGTVVYYIMQEGEVKPRQNG